MLARGFSQRFFQNHPEINLEINETSHDNAVEQLTSDGCDLALLQVPYHAPGYINEFVFSYGFCMGINKESPLSHEKEFLPAFWDGQNIAARGYKYPVFANYVKGLNSQGIYPRVILESNNDRLLLAQAEQNTAIACVSEYVARAYHGDDIAFVPINDSASRDMVYLCYRQYKEENCEGLRIFRAFLKQYTL